MFFAEFRMLIQTCIKAFQKATTCQAFPLLSIGLQIFGLGKGCWERRR